MIKQLTRTENNLYHYKDGIRIEGIHDDIYGDVSGIRGDITHIRGDISGIRGDVSGIIGDITDIRGDLTYISGNISLCELTYEDRNKSINIEDLIK